MTKAVGWGGTTEDMKVRKELRGSGGRVRKGVAWRFLGSTSNEVRGARQPTSVVLKLGAPNQCSVVPLGGRGSCRAGRQCSVLSFQFSVIAKPTPVGADAPAEPGCSAQRELRPSTIAVNTSDNAVRSCAQDFALSLFFGRGRTRNDVTSVCAGQKP